MKGSLNDGLYMLVGSTLTSSACVSTTSTKHENDDHVTSLNNEGSRIIPTYPNESMGYVDLIGN